MKPIPLLILSDSVTSTSGLGRITRDLAQRIHECMPDVFRVATIGYGGIGSRNIRWPDYHIHSMENWVVKELPAAWHDFAGDGKGILFCIWDASRLLWLTNPEQYCPNVALREFLATKPFKLWTYSAIDATGPNDRLSSLLKVVLSGFDRVLAYSEWSARIIERTLGDGKTIDALPHGIDTAIWKPRGRDKARRKFGELILGPDVDFSIGADQFLVGIVATNQARKDYGTAIEAVAMVAKERDTLVWIHTDAMERNWSISALLHDYGLANRAIITTGRLSDDQMTWAYSACDVTLGIGLNEGYGYPIFESLACGVPCIHGNCGGAPEHMPKDFLIKPIAFRYEGAFACVRPVYSAQQWKNAMLKSASVDTSLPKHLEWGQLWPRFQSWMEDGIGKKERKVSLVDGSYKDSQLTDYRAFIPYVNRPDMLKMAVDSAKDIHPMVIDNSKTGDDVRIYWNMRPSVPLSFSQTMNFMLEQCRIVPVKICIWMHSDAVAAPGTCLELLRLAREYAESGRKWGVLFTNYDALSAINMDAAEDVGEWDTNLQWYASDCDWYYRMKLRGWELIETALPVYHEPSQTLKADPLISAQVNAMFPYRKLYYAQKWGGNPGEEKFGRPFNI